MKKIILLLLSTLCLISVVNAKSINDSKIVPPDSQVYKDFLELQKAERILAFTNNTPISVSELKFYLEQFDSESLSGYSAALYQKIYDYLYEKENLFNIPGFELAAHLSMNLEGYYKTTDDIPWSFNYHFKDNLISIPLDVGFGNCFAMGADFFLGKNYIAAADNENFWNVPVNVNNISDDGLLEFNFPTFAYASIGKSFNNWGVNFQIGKQGKTIYQTLTGSIIYNNTFETDAYVEFDIYTRAVKFTMDVVQVSSNRMDNIQMDNTERYLYLHQFDIRPFKNFKVSLLEGSLVANPFSLRFLNPIPFMHQFGGWTNYISEENEDIYRETNFCADFAFMFEYIPVSNLRLYGIYNQIELQLPWERNNSWGRYYPNTIGLQFGADYSLIFSDLSKLQIEAEYIYNSPYMYIKQTPSASLYRVRMDMQTHENVYSWIGSPYGPDCMGGELKLTYDRNTKWKVELGYAFIAKGEHDFSIFERTVYNPDSDAEYYNYYPSVIYKLQEDEISDKEYTNDQLYDMAMDFGMSGVKQYNNIINLKASYEINEHFELTGQIQYNYIINNLHIENKNDAGLEVDLAVTYNIF